MILNFRNLETLKQHIFLLYRHYNDILYSHQPTFHSKYVHNIKIFIYFFTPHHHNKKSKKYVKKISKKDVYVYIHFHWTFFIFISKYVYFFYCPHHFERMLFCPLYERGLWGFFSRHFERMWEIHRQWF